MPEDIGPLSAAAAREDVIIFVGSGVSAGSGLPTWRGLLERLAQYLTDHGRPAELVRRELSNNDLLLAASYGFDQLLPLERCDFLRSTLRIPAVAPSPVHRAIADLGTKCFITTNYDGLLERALQEVRPDEFFDVVTPLQPLEIASIMQAQAKGFIFKPHGDLGSCDSIVLTREDYRSLYGDKRNVLEALRTLLVSRPIIFIGYGLRDPDFLLIQDLLTTTFGTNPSEHYALMPDLVPEEASYWRRNYGITLISYPTRSDAASSGRNHEALLSILQDIPRPVLKHKLLEANQQNISAQILALARHARRIQSVIPAASDVIPVRLEQDFRRRRSANAQHTLRIGPDVRKFLIRSNDRFVLEGPPGAGKTFLIEQAARDLACELERVCLANEVPRIEDVRVPVIIYLRDYRDNIEEMFKRALPFDISLDGLLENGTGSFFIDGFNEAPVSASENSRLMSDLEAFLGRTDRCDLVITTRFGSEIEDLDLPVALLDEISAEYVAHELDQVGIEAEDIDSVTFELLQRPLFHKAWKEGVFALDQVNTVHDVYRQLIRTMEQGARRHFEVTLAFTEVFERIAYAMIDSGRLFMSLGEVYGLLRSALRGLLDAREFLNYAIATSILLATPTRNVTFFHHSVAEYFAAQHLSDVIQTDNSALQHCLGRHDWDHALLLTLGVLPAEKARTTFEEITRVDHAMALRALNYIEADRSQWTENALESLFAIADDEDAARLAEFALSQLKVRESNIETLFRLAQYKTGLGGAAAGLLWTISEVHREWVLDCLVDTAREYNFLAALARIVRSLFNLQDGIAVVGRLSSMEIEQGLAEEIRRGDDIEGYTGVINACSDVLEMLPAESLIEVARNSSSVLIERIVCDALRHTRTGQAIEFVQKCIIGGSKHAIVTLYFQLEFGLPLDSELSMPSSGLRDSLLAALWDDRMAGWALGDIRLLARSLPEFASGLADDIVQYDGMVAALLAYATGDENRFFEILLDVSTGPIEMLRIPSVEALSHVEISWRGREELVLKLLRRRDRALSRALIESLDLYRAMGESLEVACSVSDLEWWTGWLREMESNYMFCNRLGIFLANGTDTDTQRSIIARFNQVSADRFVLAEHVLGVMQDVSIGDFTADSLEWLMGQLHTGRYSEFHDPLIGKIATEEFVQERLVPLLLEAPSGALRHNLLISLRSAGRRHRRRYIGDDEEVLG